MAGLPAPLPFNLFLPINIPSGALPTYPHFKILIHMYIYLYFYTYINNIICSMLCGYVDNMTFLLQVCIIQIINVDNYVDKMLINIPVMIKGYTIYG